MAKHHEWHLTLIGGLVSLAFVSALIFLPITLIRTVNAIGSSGSEVCVNVGPVEDSTCAVPDDTGSGDTGDNGNPPSGGNTDQSGTGTGNTTDTSSSSQSDNGGSTSSGGAVGSPINNQGNSQPGNTSTPPTGGTTAPPSNNGSGDIQDLGSTPTATQTSSKSSNIIVPVATSSAVVVVAGVGIWWFVRARYVYHLALHATGLSHRANLSAQHYASSVHHHIMGPPSHTNHQ